MTKQKTLSVNKQKNNTFLSFKSGFHGAKGTQVSPSPLTKRERERKEKRQRQGNGEGADELIKLFKKSYLAEITTSTVLLDMAGSALSTSPGRLFCFRL